MVTTSLSKRIINLARVCNQCNAHSDYLILEHYSLVMATGRLRAKKTKRKAYSKQLINLKRFNGLYKKFSNLCLAVMTLRGQLGLRFSPKTSLSVNK